MYYCNTRIVRVRTMPGPGRHSALIVDVMTRLQALAERDINYKQSISVHARVGLVRALPIVSGRVRLSWIGVSRGTNPFWGSSEDTDPDRERSESRLGEI